MVELGGSDLHLAVGLPPCVRIDGSLRPLEGYPAPERLRDPPDGLRHPDPDASGSASRPTSSCDTSHSIPGLGRFRVNVFLQRDSVGAVMRAIPNEVVPFESLGLPGAVGAVRRAAAGPGAGHRSDRVRQVDDPGLGRRHHQHHASRCTS